MTDSTHSTTPDDPLDGADPGDTVTIEHEKTIHGINIAPVGDYGADRESRMEIAAIERVENPREGYFDDIRVCWREEVTKQLPMQLHDDPIDLDAYRRRKRARETAKKVPEIPTWLSRALNLGLGSAVALGGTWLVVQEIDGAMMMNGHPVSFTADAFAGVVVLTLLIAFVLFSLPYLPRPSIGRGGLGR